MSTDRPVPATDSGAATGTCAHCHLPLPERPLGKAGRARFCCTGCQAAWAILHEHGLDAYYALPREDGAPGAPVAPSGKSYAEFDHTAFHDLYVRRGADGLGTVELYLEGVHCSACVWLVERVPLAIPGVQRAELDVTRALARITFDAAQTPLSAVARFLDQLGYRPHPFRGVKQDQMRRREDRALVAKIGVAGALTTNVMLLALAQYAGWFTGMEAQYEQFFRWWSLALTVPAIAWPGRTFFTGAWAALRTRALHMDLPVALALGAGFVRGAWNTWQGSGPIYFDGVTFLIFLLLVGRFIQQRAQRQAADAAELLYALSPASARVVDGDGVREVPVEALLPGVVLDVRPGDVLAADGIVVRGRSSLDCSLLTGESRPVRVDTGTAVFAGTVNLDAPLRVRVEQAGEASRLGRLLKDVEEGARRRAPMVQLADRLSGWFVLGVLCLAALTLAVWWPEDPTKAIDYAIAMLVVTCPCALALATPLSMHSAIGQAARAGILVKNGAALERLAGPARLFLDKTGTLTEGRPSVAAFAGDPTVAPFVLALERHAVHPVARAFLEAWPGTAIPEADDVKVTVGGGVEGIVHDREVCVGSPAFVLEVADCDEVLAAKADGFVTDGLTPVLVAVDGVVVAAAGIGDAVRPGTREAIARLRALGYRPVLLSGDHPTIVRAVARQLGLAPEEALGGMSPEDKLRIVAEASARGPTVMVGDGVNDAGAIAAAGVGVGVHGGAEACLATADVYLARPGLGTLVELAEGARRTLGLIRGLLGVSLLYNLAGSALAITGHMDPLVAAVLMPGTSVINVIAAWRIATFPAPARRAA